MEPDQDVDMGENSPPNNSQTGSPQHDGLTDAGTFSQQSGMADVNMDKGRQKFPSSPKFNPPHMYKEEEEDVKRRAPPESPRSDARNFDESPPPTPRLSAREIDLDEEPDYQDIELETTSPTRPLSRLGTRTLTRSYSISRSFSLAQSFSQPNIPSTMSEDTNMESGEPETRIRTRGGRSSGSAHELLHPTTYASSPSPSSSEAPSSIAGPTYPTPSPSSALPELQDTSITILAHLTNLIQAAKQAGAWGSEENKEEFVSYVSEWEELLEDIINGSGFLSPTDESPAPQLPRHGKASYAFTKLTVSKAHEAHTRIHNQLVAAADNLYSTDTEALAKEVKGENDKVWSHVKMAYDSDKANEVCGKSWAYGVTDWKRGVVDPEPIGWAGGKKTTRPPPPVWPGSVREDLVPRRLQR